MKADCCKGRGRGRGGHRIFDPPSLVNCIYQSRPFLCIAYGEGVVLIIDVVRANEFLQDEIGIRTSPDSD